MIAYDKNLQLMNFHGVNGYENYLRAYCSSNDLRRIWFKSTGSYDNDDNGLLFDKDYYIKDILSLCKMKGGD